MEQCIKIYDCNKKYCIGTGFFISKNGYVITAKHVLEKGNYGKISRKMKIYFKYAIDGFKDIHIAKLEDFNNNIDIVVCKTDEDIKDNYLMLFYPDKENGYNQIKGEKVYAYGFTNVHPKGLNDRGTFVGLEGNGKLQVNDMNVTDNGFSGSPLVYQNNVIGVNVTKEDVEHTNIAYYIPSQRILEYFPKLPHNKIYDECNEIEILEQIVNSEYKIDFTQYKPKIYELKQKCIKIKKLNLSPKDESRINDVIYRLSEICENGGEFYISLELIKIIFDYFNIKDKNILSMENEKKQIRQYIGCIYSLIVCNTNDLEQRRKNLKEAKKHMDFAKKYMDKTFKINEKKWDKKDVNFLWGQYYSDLGAYLLSNGKYKIELAKEDFKKALDIHRNALEIRQELSEILNELNISESEEEPTKNTNEKRISISYRNIGTAHFYLNEYKESIENSKNALKHIEKINDKDQKDQYLQTLDCITGSYEKIFDTQDFINYTNIHEMDLKDCFAEDCRFLKETINGYRFDKTYPRVRKAIKRIEKLTRICQKEEELNKIFNLILEKEFIKKLK